MRTDELSYDLPKERIAQQPKKPRDTSKLLILERKTGKLKQDLFLHLHIYLESGSLLVVNETKVLKARFSGRKPTGGKVEALLVKKLNPQEAIALLKSSRPIKPPACFCVGSHIVEVLQRERKGYRIRAEKLEKLLREHGKLPLPPYIKQALKKESQYQTIFARKEGAIAASTAALHFTPRVIKRCREKNIRLARVLLHTGMDTFLPIKTETLEAHPMHREYYEIPMETQKAILAAKEEGKPVVAVGTTVVRALETYWITKKTLGETDLFITPGFQFQVVDQLITNFHFPRSTLLALVMAFAGQAHIRKAYDYALAHHFRFLSFGDAMLIRS